MQPFFSEQHYRNATELNQAELKLAIQTQEILQSTALAFDTSRQLHFAFHDARGIMPFEACADGAQDGSIRDIAVLTRVGKATCFIVQQYDDTTNTFLLSRTKAQELYKKNYLNNVQAGDILRSTVTHIEPFGAFCDIGCGISALLPIDCMSVSRIASPHDRLHVGQDIYCVIKNRDAQGRFVLSIRELLGTWMENATRFHVGETVVGIVRSIEPYGTFIELAPNLAGLAECCHELCAGQTVSVYIKNILPDKMKIKLVIVNRNLSQNIRFDLHYFITNGHIKEWVYSTPESKKQISTCFCPANV